MPFLLVLLLAAVPARALDDFTLTLRLENGSETRKAVVVVEPGANRNTSFTSTDGPREDTVLFNLMAAPTPIPHRVDLSYQFEWSRVENGKTVFVRQGVDWSRIPVEREVLLLDFDGEWKLWGLVDTGQDRSCRKPPKGGGLRASVRVDKAGVKRTFTRRTSDGATSALTIGAGEDTVFDFTLTPRLAKDFKSADVDYAFAGKDPGEEEERPPKTAPLGKETKLEDGIFLTLERIPLEDDADPTELPVRDPDTGWYGYSGKTVAFSYPPEWKLSETCGADREPQGWNLVNRAEPHNPLHAVHVWGMLLPPRDAELSESGDSELLEVNGGICRVWRDEVADPLCRENCAASLIARAECVAKKEGGPHTVFHFDLGREAGLDTERYGRFLRFVKTFRL